MIKGPIYGLSMLAPLRLKEPWKTPSAMPHGKSVLVGQIITEYLYSNLYRDLKPSSKERYLSSLRLFENLIIGTGKNIYAMRAPKVDYSVTDNINKVLSYKLEPSTISFHFSVMSAVWKQALRTGRVIHNPWASPGIKLNNDRDITWTKEEIHTACKVSKELGHNTLALYILMMYETGQRPWKDLRNLTWNNVKENNGKKILDFVISKTKVHLMLPLSASAVQELDKITKDHEYIFVDNNGNRPVQGVLAQQFNRVKKIAKIRPELQFRDIRRTVVTEMAEAGSTSEEIRAITGWKNSNVMHRYARVRYKTAQNGMEKRERGRTTEGAELYKEFTPPKKYFEEATMSELPGEQFIFNF